MPLTIRPFDIKSETRWRSTYSWINYNDWPGLFPATHANYRCIRPPYRIGYARIDGWRLLLLDRLVIELVTAWLTSGDGAGVQLFASRSEKQIPVILYFNVRRVDLPRFATEERGG
jgi:hypothetical protein